ncbi:hypothetical protein P5V15_007270 [Pogonomyrmex californicus]
MYTLSPVTNASHESVAHGTRLSLLFTARLLASRNCRFNSESFRRRDAGKESRPASRDATRRHVFVIVAQFMRIHFTCAPDFARFLSHLLFSLRSGTEEETNLGFFTYYTVAMGEVNPSGPVPIDSVFIYRPDKRLELWRFAFYMFLHAGWLHLLFNLGVQVVVGLPLEMVHGSLRIAAVYMAGVLAGSLGTSVFDTDVYLVGASGGVYALLAAHLANVLLNYNNMEFGIVRLIGIFVIASADVGFAIYDRYAAEQMGPPVSYVAHLTGALAGLTIGLLVLKNFEQRLHEQLLWWVALGVYAACTIFAIMYNLMHPDYP